MYSKIILVFIGLLASIKSAFAESALTKPFDLLLGEEGLIALLRNDYAMAGIYFVMFVVVFNTVIRIALTPMFNNFHTRERNTIALMLSLIGTTSIFYMFLRLGSGGIREVVLLFGGAISFIVLVFTCLILYWWVDTAALNTWGVHRMSWQWILSMGLLTIINSTVLLNFLEAADFLLTGSFIWSAVQETLGTLFSLGLIALIIALIMIFASMRRSDSNRTQASIDRNPNYKKAKHIIDEIEESANEINKSLENIWEVLGGQGKIGAGVDKIKSFFKGDS